MTDGNHMPAAVPGASPTRGEILKLLRRAESPELGTFLEERLFSTLAPKEVEACIHALRIADMLIREYDAFGDAQCAFLAGLAGELAATAMTRLPPKGEPHECN